MGHYDDCYANEDFRKMSSSEKASYIDRFRKELKKHGETCHTCDDVSGWILAEWAASQKDLIIVGSHRSTIVRTKTFHAEFLKKQKDAAEKAQREQLAQDLKLHGWDLDKNLNDFQVVVEGLRRDGQQSRADVMEYLLERCRRAEARQRAY